jgi:HK97 family phage portal protein
MTPEEFIGQRTAARTGQVVTPDTALRNSAVWACLRLRADLISTFPVDVYRKVGKGKVEVPKPRVLIAPGGDQWDYQDWMYATQFDLDRAGNDCGFIRERDGKGFPSLIELVALGTWTVVEKKDTGALVYRIDGKDYPPEQVWHERQYVVAGLPVGLSPLAYAATVIGENLAITNFAESWFSQGAVPAAHLRNSQKVVPPKQAAEIKARFKASVSVGDPFVSGNDWEYNPLQIQQMGMEWLEDRKFSLTDIARFFGCPSDLIDAAVQGQNVTYANITQRNLQFLIMNLGPAVARREKNLSKLTPAPRYVKLNTDALLRMDPATRATAIKTQLDARVLTNSEARALDDRPPLTQTDIDEYATIYGAPRTQPTTAVS